MVRLQPGASAIQTATSVLGLIAGVGPDWRIPRADGPEPSGKSLGAGRIRRGEGNQCPSLAAREARSSQVRAERSPGVWRNPSLGIQGAPPLGGRRRISWRQRRGARRGREWRPGTRHQRPSNRVTKPSLLPTSLPGPECSSGSTACGLPKREHEKGAVDGYYRARAIAGPI